LNYLSGIPQASHSANYLANYFNIALIKEVAVNRFVVKRATKSISTRMVFGLSKISLAIS
jgi:hypothetical protein